MLYILTFVAIAGLSAGLGFIFGQRSQWSRRRIALVSALPIAIITWGLAAIMLAVAIFDRADVCDDRDCSTMMTGVGVMVALGFVAYALGIVFALVGLQFARSRNPLHDVFE